MQIRRIYLTLLCSFLVVKSFAQTEPGVQNIHSARVTLVPLGLGYGYEHALARRTTLNTELLLSGGISSGGSEGLALAGLAPVLRVEPRFYYSYLKRAGKGKQVTNNSASFLSLALENKFNAYLTNRRASVNTLTLMPKWGLRRAIGPQLFFEGAVGVGVSYDKQSKFEVVPGLDVRFGYAF